MKKRFAQIASEGTSSFARRSIEWESGAFASELAGQSAERAVLLAAGLDALRDESSPSRVNAERARLHAAALERGRTRRTRPEAEANDVKVMPVDVAKIALNAFRMFLEERVLVDDVGSEFYPRAIIDSTLGAASFLQKLAQAKVAFPPELSQAYLKLVGRLIGTRIGPSLISAVGGSAAKRAALCSLEPRQASRCARFFYDEKISSDVFTQNDVEAALPGRSRRFSVEREATVELLKFMNPSQAREYVFSSTTSWKSPDALRALAALSVDLTPEDSLRIEEFLETILSSPYEVGDADLIRYAKALVTKTRADSNLRRRALAAAKACSKLRSSTLPEDLEYLPLDEWTEIFRKEPRALIRDCRDRRKRRALLRKARISFLIFGASPEWERELIQPRNGLNDKEYFSFLSELLRTRVVSVELARAVVDACLRERRKMKRGSSFPFEHFFLVSHFEPYPTRPKFNEEFDRFVDKTLRNYAIQEKIRGERGFVPIPRFYTRGKTWDKRGYFIQNILPWLPDDPRPKEEENEFVFPTGTTFLNYLRHVWLNRAGGKRARVTLEQSDVLREYLKERATTLGFNGQTNSEPSARR